MFKNILLAFIPLFVAVDAVGVLPIFTSLTEGFKKKEIAKIIFQSIMTASCLAVAFIFLGRWVFKVLGITVADFMVAGGILLFAIAIMDIMNPEKRHRIPSEQVGAVPIGTPLIVGPAVLTTSLILLEEYGVGATLISVLANVAIAGITFSLSKPLMKLFGIAGSRALSKVMSLLLAAIAVMMIRKGIFSIIKID